MRPDIGGQKGSIPAATHRLFSYPLPVPRQTVYERFGIGPEATAAEVRDASAEYVRRLQAEGASEDKVAQANAMKLESGEQRAAYDAEHPPLALLRLVPPQSSLFQDRDHALAVLRRELERLLSSRGEAVYFPLDVTRTDFTSDFDYSPVLDPPRDRTEPPTQHRDEPTRV
jgi:hypothetical protein